MGDALKVPDYEKLFGAAIRYFWNIRRDQAAKQLAAGTDDTGTRGAVTGGKQLDGVAQLIGRVLVEAGLNEPNSVTLPGYYRRSKSWDVVSLHDASVAATIELKSHIGSIGNNANNRIEEMIGQSIDYLRASREDMLGTLSPWFGYFMLFEDSRKSRGTGRNPREHEDFLFDPVFDDTDYIQRYVIALSRLRLERELNSACLVVSSSDGEYWYPDNSMSFQAFATTLYSRSLDVRSQLGLA